MRAFANLLDRLSYEPQRNAKLRILSEYFRSVPDPDRGFALAALTGQLSFAAAKPALVRGLAEARVDPVLFRLSYDYVGDLAETVALIWPMPAGEKEEAPPRLGEVVAALSETGKVGLPSLLEGWLDRLAANERWALIKLVTGGLRVGVSARLAKTARSQLGERRPEEIEEIWHGQQAPYLELFAWAEGGPPPPVSDRTGFRPPMLAHPLDEAELAELDPADFRAEWKWDGVRVQFVGAGAGCRLYSRTGEDLSAAFPEFAAGAPIEAVLDGELLIVREDRVQAFGELQKRLNRKSVGARLLASHPARIRLYDILFEAEQDLRPLPFAERRARLEAWFQAHPQDPRFDLSPLVGFDGWTALARLRRGSAEPGCEGLMLKRASSPYLAGRLRGHWFKWKRDPYLIDAVLMYAMRGHGKRSSYYSDYTFGVWSDGALVPVGKAYFGFSDEELAELDRWIRRHTRARFGPVREVEPALVLEVAFEGVGASSRHKSGIALRFPRVHRIRWDKPAAEADRIEALKRLLAGTA